MDSDQGKLFIGGISWEEKLKEYFDNYGEVVMRQKFTVQPRGFGFVVLSDPSVLYKSEIKMALRGVWQLQKLIVNYCDWGGSSRGIRAFMESQLPAFRESNPQLEVVTELIRGQHPHLKGLYKNKSQRVVCVKNLDPEEILHYATRLRNSLGRKVVKLRTRHVTKHPSVQGTWSTDVRF